MKRQILFVDDEQKVLDGLQRMLRSMRHEWEMSFVASGYEALEVLDRKPFDVVVSDMRMPGMDGAQLLTLVRERHPRVVRIILSGYSDQEMVMKSVRVAHQYLSKPCDSDSVKFTVMRAFALRNLLANEALLRVVSQIETLPSVPSVYQEVVKELHAPDASIDRIAEIMSKDISMTAKILQLANSAFFGLRQHVNSLNRALALLGLDTLVALVMSVQIFSKHEHTSVPGFSIPNLMDHSMKTGAVAKAIAKEEKQDQALVNDAFMGGLLHDVGKLILATGLTENFNDINKMVQETHCSLRQAEHQILGTTHAEVGAYLMGLWGLPDPIVEAIAFHHSPGKCVGKIFSPLTAVHVGDVLTNGGLDGGAGEAEDPLDLDYLAELHYSDRLPSWKAASEQFIR